MGTVCMSLTIFLEKGQANEGNEGKKLKFQGKKRPLAMKHNRKLPAWF